MSGCGAAGESGDGGERVSFVAAIWVRREARRRRSSGAGYEWTEKGGGEGGSIGGGGVAGLSWRRTGGRVVGDGRRGLRNVDDDVGVGITMGVCLAWWWLLLRTMGAAIASIAAFQQNYQKYNTNRKS